MHVQYVPYKTRIFLWQFTLVRGSIFSFFRQLRWKIFNGEEILIERHFLFKFDWFLVTLMWRSRRAGIVLIIDSSHLAVAGNGFFTTKQILHGFYIFCVSLCSLISSTSLFPHIYSASPMIRPPLATYPGNEGVGITFNDNHDDGYS